MKKILYSAAAMALAFLAASCQKEVLEPVASGNTVTYTVQVADAVATRALGDEIDAVNELVYEVYRTTAEGVEEFSSADNLLYHKTATITNGTATIEIEFVNDQNFTVLFWAHVQGNDVYDVDDLTEVTITSPDVANNVNAQAFVGRDFVRDCVSDKNGKVTLVRPVSQLNIATTPESLVFEAEAGETGSTVLLEGSSVKVSGLATSYNIATLSAFGATATEYTYTETAVPADVLPVNGKNYTYVAMNYVGFAPEMGTSDVTVSYVINTSEGYIDNEILNVPVKPNYRTNIIGNLITSKTEYEITLDKTWDIAEGTVAMDADAAQAALDCAVDGSYIQLQPGVNYGTLYIRPVEGQNNTITDCDYLVYRNEMLRKVENLTIKGAPGATVDAIKVIAGHIEGSTGYVADIKNLVIDAVEFTDKNTNAPHSYAAPIFFDLTYTNVDGLTVKNCKLEGNNDKLNFVYVYGSGNPSNSTFETAAKNITIKDNTVDGIARLCELRQTENVTITGNTIKNTALHGILLPVDNGTYTGNVTITGNTAEGINERFVRMAGAGDAAVVIKDNTIANYLGADSDYIKVTDGTNVTIENNTLGVSTAEQLELLVNNAKSDIEIGLTADIEGDVTLVQKAGVKVTILGKDKKYEGTIKVHSNSNHHADAALTIKNVNFETSVASINFIEALENGSERYSTNITVEGCTFTATGEAVNTAVGVQIKASKNAKVLNCTATGVHSLIQAQSCDETVVVNGCTVNGKNGVAFKQVKAATVEGTIITATEYGIRFDGNIDNYGITVKGNNVTAKQPFIVRKMTGQNNTITLEGENTLTTDAGYQIVITNGQDDAEYVIPTGTYTLTGADSYSVFPTLPKAKVGNTEYYSMDEAIAAWTNGTTLTLLANVTLTDVVMIKSTEARTLDLGTYTLTAASGKNAIEVTCEGRSSASYALTVNADATNPGGITAKGKACIYYSKSDSTKDRPIIRIYNGVFNGSYSINSKSNGNTNCPQIWIYGGVFNGNVNLTKNMLRVWGGTFHGWINCTGDSSAYREISGGRFKSWQFMTADADSKFWVGTSKANYDVGCYVDDEGYLVVGGPVITDFDGRFQAKATNPTKWSSYLKYSSAAEHGLYYTNAELAIKKHGEANVVLP